MKRQIIKPFHLLLGSMAFSVAMTATAHGDRWTLTTADFHPQLVTISELSWTTLEFAPMGMGQPRELGVDQLLSLRREGPAQPTAAEAFNLELVDGEKIAGKPLRIEGEKLVWQNGLLGEFSIPLHLLMGMSRNGQTAAAGTPPPQDIVRLGNNDMVSGAITGCTADGFTVQTDTGPTPVPMASVASILFASTGTPAASHGQDEPKEQRYLVSFADGSMIDVSGLVISGSEMKWQAEVDAAVKRNIVLGDVISIEHLNGPVSWLSSRRPTENVQLPYFPQAAVWPARFDLAVDGTPLRAGDRLVERGIGVHAYSKLSFAIEPGWKFFRTQFAVGSEEPSAAYADVTLRILLDDRVAFEKVHVQGTAVSDVINIDLAGAKTLTLEAIPGGAGDVADRVNWIEPAFLREGIVTTSAAAAPASQP